MNNGLLVNIDAVSISALIINTAKVDGRLKWDAVCAYDDALTVALTALAGNTRDVSIPDFNAFSFKAKLLGVVRLPDGPSGDRRMGVVFDALDSAGRPG